MFHDFPSLHPFAVHFPIVLILIAAAFQMVLVWRDWKQIRWATLILMGLAFLSALAASTFFHAEPSPDVPKASMEMFESHEKFARFTLWMSGITFLLKIIGIFFKINRRIFEIIVLIAAIITAGFLSIAAHHGAKLTHIAGVGPMGRYLMKEHGMGGDHIEGHDMEGGDMKEHGMEGNDMKGMEMKGDSAMKMNDKMPGMDTMKNMKGDSMKDMKDMKGMDKMKGMPGMKNKKDMKDMKNMPGMDTMKNMKGMENMKDMKNMPGMDTMKNMKGMENMKDMKNIPGMDTMKKMDGMDMPGMDMKSAMDTIRFPDNNPARRKSKKTGKQ